LAIRYLLLSVPYRKQLNFTFEGLKAAESTVERLRNFRSLVKEGGSPTGSDGASSQASDGDTQPTGCDSAAAALKKFEEAMDDDLNTAAALAAVHDMVREVNTIIAANGLTEEEKSAVLDAVAKFDAVLGIFGREDSDLLDEDVEALIAERQDARRHRNFARSDEIRDELAAKGIILEDTKDGMRWRRK
ncbi:MAG: cysteine--tRNA ligase, partial [Acidobacteria bacterium]|nr:cysteine--tRNA ligase [Acidobacteriota bacterium]